MFIKKNYLYLIVCVLFLVIFLQRCENNKPIIPIPPRVKIDTVWVTRDSIVYSKPKIITIIKGVPEIQYVPDTSYTKLVIQYKSLVDLCTAKNVYSDTLKIDSIGYVNVKDTVSKNRIQGRSYNYNLKYPIITKTITVQAPPKTQVYIGGGLQGNPYNIVNQFSAGLLLKTKKDKIYGVYTGMSKDGRIQYGLQSYWKINFNKL
jgi:hypothetical protein